ncbi:MAG: four helix bundle protein [Candidatus Moranbacteria bacterium]|nr:four helix bundle protein [Candidatus Moranbacteria bacterium]
MATGLEHLKIYKLAERIEIFIHKLTEKFPKDEKYRMVDQLRRSSNSVTSNIAEGYGRYSYKEKIRYMYIARGEAFETKQGLIRSFKKEFYDEEILIFIENKITELLKGINGYINFLKKKEKSTNDSRINQSTKQPSN